METRSGRGGRRFKSCHSDQYLAWFRMTAPTVIPTETGGEQHLSMLAQDAAEALIALGWPVLPHGPDINRRLRHHAQAA